MTTLRTRLAAGSLALGLLGAAGFGAYSVAQSAAEQAFAQAIDRMRAAVAPDFTIEHGAITAEPVSGRITVANLAYGPTNRPQERLRAPLVTIEGILPQGAGAARISADNLALTIPERGQPHTVLSLGGLRVAGLSLSPAGAPFVLGDTRLDALDLTALTLNPADRDNAPVGRIGRIALGQIGGDRRDSILVEGVDLALPNMVVAERLVLGRLATENIGTLRILEAMLFGGLPPVPTDTARLSVEGLALTEGALPVLRLARFATEGTPIGGDVNHIRGALTIEGFDASLPPMLGPFALGYERVRIDLAIQADTQIVAGDVNLRSFRLALPEIGTLEMTAEMTGLGAGAADPMNAGLLHRFALRYTDAGLVARALEEGAKQSGMRADQLRQQLEQMSPVLFSGPAAEANIRAIRSFLQRPTTIGITAAPAAPVALSDLEREGGRTPDAIARLLNITVTSP
jgi:hypothetical protein